MQLYNNRRRRSQQQPASSMQENRVAGRYIYEMAIAEINMNSIHAGRFAPPVPVQPAAAQKPKTSMSAEEALNILKLVNVGKQVLELSSFNKPPQTMIMIAESIISARKNGSEVEFENGRIHVPEELFNNIVRGCEKGPDRNLNGFSNPITYVQNKPL